MNTVSDEWKRYVKDPRNVCKYGEKCYQKNPQHHETFKHPPKAFSHRHNHRNRCQKPYSRDNGLKRNDGEVPKNQIDVTVSNNDLPSNSEDVKCTDESENIIRLPKNLSFYNKDTDPQLYKQLFMVDMPTDFYKFFECLTKDEESVKKSLDSVNLELIGPYDILLGKLPILDEKELYLVHWRFFYDPPEFQAVIKKKGNSEFHIGYFRDDPNEMPVFIASNDSAKGCHITPMSDNLFGAIYIYLQEEKKSPFTAIACQKLMAKLKKTADENKYSLEKFEMKNRLSKIVTKTLHGAGIVVPYNKKTELGYRHLVESDANIKKIFEKLKLVTSQHEKDKVLSELQPIITYANIAVDECDFGTGLEMGIDLFCSGLKELESNALNCLRSSYNLLKREPFSEIIQAHIKYRRKGPNTSLLYLRKE